MLVMASSRCSAAFCTACRRMGLGFGGANGNAGAKPVKSARVVGDVLGRFHPARRPVGLRRLGAHGAGLFSSATRWSTAKATSASRDGDGAAAMRYTEARLAKITSAAAGRNRPGHGRISSPTTTAPPKSRASCPRGCRSRLLNGASGIAVGLATEIPSHNLREVADACVAPDQDAQTRRRRVVRLMPGPDFPVAARSSAAASDIADAYRSGRGFAQGAARAGRLKTWRAASGNWSSPSCRPA